MRVIHLMASRILSRPSKKMSTMAALISLHSTSMGLSYGVWGARCNISMSPPVSSRHFRMVTPVRVLVLSAIIPTFL